MKFHSCWAVTALFVVASGASPVTHAALISRQNGAAVYDTDFNITWLASANTNGLMTWSQANTWAAGLTVGGFSGWRLPTTLQPDASCGIQYYGLSYGYNCTGSEMGHLFYTELGGVAGQSIATSHNANYNLFYNVQSNNYWSGKSTRRVPTMRGSSVPTTTARASALRAIVSTRWLFVPAMLPPSRYLRRRGCWVLACWA